ncbi:MAG: DUF1549 domain-containing protein [Armatimonadetes bacterium]|nr:DUF1549 domain-containing protein [Armatimonadota bacterium]MDE2207251.1 DUF1549 domain-containing protein [Armatimonadota bacterium]
MKWYPASMLLLLAAAAMAWPQHPGKTAWPRQAKHSSAGSSVGIKTAAGRRLDYATDVKPILVRSCYGCHADGMRLGGLSLATRAGLLHGGVDGAAVVLGHPNKSKLIQLVSGLVPGMVMPARGPRLSVHDIGVLKVWIDEGAPFDKAGSGADWTPLLFPRNVKLPPAAPGLTNPIDRLVRAYDISHHIAASTLVSDRVYARRVWLDLIGLLPPPAALKAFLRSRVPDKRAMLVQSLLSDNADYATHWISFWNDMLRNDYTGTGYIDGGRTQITGWLYDALAGNMPYNQFVAQLVNPIPASSGFIKGIEWRGVVNASQTPQMQAAQNIAQVFLGVNLKCASCHDSFISTWKLTDSYGMAGIYADGPLEMYRCDRPLGVVAPVRFMYPQLGSIDAHASKAERMRQLAAIITSPRDGRLTRTFVNRIWGRLMGRALVEPQDDMDQQPWDADLLDWLATDFAAHGYNVRRLLTQIATSRAYASASVGGAPDVSPAYVFHGPQVKRMTAEQFVDGVSTITGVWSSPADAPFAIQGGAPVLPAGARLAYASPVLRSGSVAIRVPLTGAATVALIATATGPTVTDDWADWVEPTVETTAGSVPLTSLRWSYASSGYGEAHTGSNIVNGPLNLGGKTWTNGIGTHADSIILYRLPAHATELLVTAGPDAAGVAQGKGVTAIRLFIAVGGSRLSGVRAALAAADPLTTALGRPNRDQVVTARAADASTLQAMELTNGETLNGMIEQGARRMMAAYPNPHDLVNRLWEVALGRRPTAREGAAALGMTGNPASPAGVQDLLWAVMMLPEFQLEY